MKAFTQRFMRSNRPALAACRGRAAILMCMSALALRCSLARECDNAAACHSLFERVPVAAESGGEAPQMSELVERGVTERNERIARRLEAACSSGDVDSCRDVVAYRVERYHAVSTGIEQGFDTWSASIVARETQSKQSEQDARSSLQSAWTALVAAAFARARSENTVRSYAAFEAEFSQTEQAREARVRRARLELQAVTANSRSSATFEALDAWHSRYPDLPDVEPIAFELANQRATTVALSWYLRAFSSSDGVGVRDRLRRAAAALDVLNFQTISSRTCSDTTIVALAEFARGRSDEFVSRSEEVAWRCAQTPPEVLSAPSRFIDGLAPRIQLLLSYARSFSSTPNAAVARRQRIELEAARAIAGGESDLWSFLREFRREARADIARALARCLLSNESERSSSEFTRFLDDVPGAPESTRAAIARARRAALAREAAAEARYRAEEAWQRARELRESRGESCSACVQRQLSGCCISDYCASANGVFACRAIARAQCGCD